MENLKETILKAHSQGISITQLSKELGVNRKTLTRHLKSWGVETNRKGHPKNTHNKKYSFNESFF